MTEQRKLSDADFLLKAVPLMEDPATRLQDLAEATGLTISGVRHKLAKLGIKRVARYVIPMKGA